MITSIKKVHEIKFENNLETTPIKNILIKLVENIENVQCNMQWSVLVKKSNLYLIKF